VDRQSAGDVDVAVEVELAGLDVDLAVVRGRVGGGEVVVAAAVEPELSGADEGADGEADALAAGSGEGGGARAVLVVVDLNVLRAAAVVVLDETGRGDEGRNRGDGGAGVLQRDLIRVCTQHQYASAKGDGGAHLGRA